MNERALRIFVGKYRSRRVGRRARRLSLYMAFSLAVLSLWPALALACPPILRSVTVEPNENHPTSVWTLPSNVTSQFIQVSESSDVTPDGYFRKLTTFNTLAPAQTTFFDEFEFPDGVYYVHVAGHDKRCPRESVCPPIEFSEVMSFEVTTPPPAPAAATASVSDRVTATAAPTCSDASPGGSPLPSTTGGPGPDRVAPIASLSFAPVQRVGKLFVRGRMSEAGTLTARATVSVPGSSKLYRFKTVSRSVAGNVVVKLRLKLAKKKLKSVKRALGKGKRLKAKISVTATDKARNKKAQKATIRLKK